MKKYILSAIVISVVCIFASCGDKNSESQTENQSATTSENVQIPTEQDSQQESQQETESQPELAIDAEIGAELFGRWEAVNILGKPDYNGVPAAVFNQWEFFDDGLCVFYMNGVGAEEDSFSCDSDGTIKIVCDNQSKQVLNFVLKDNILTWVEAGTGSEMDFQKVDEFTTVDNDTFENAF